MPRHPSDAALRRLVADLAKATNADVRAILSELDPDQRGRVEILLASFLGERLPEAAKSQDASSALNLTAGLSAELAQRVHAGLAPSPPATEWAMTSRALTALQDAASLCRAAQLAPPAPYDDIVGPFRRLRRDLGQRRFGL